MFQRAKDRKAREEELIRQRSLLGAMGQAMARVADSSTQAEAAVAEMQENQESLAQSLNQVVSMVHRIREGEEARTKEETGLHRQLSQLCQSLRQREESRGLGLEQARQQHQAVCRVAEQTQGTAGLLEDLNHWAQGLAGQLEQMTEQVAAMEEQGRTMSVLSLNSAIEAGRMGEAGRKFVTAAEEVRGCAGEYRERASQISQELLGLKEGLEEAAKELEHLKVCQEKAAADWKKAVEGFDESLIQPDTADGQLLELCRSWEQTGGRSQDQEDLCQQILQQLEAAGESYMEEQQLLEQFDCRQQEIQEAIKERRAWG